MGNTDYLYYFSLKTKILLNYDTLKPTTKRLGILL